VLQAPIAAEAAPTIHHAMEGCVTGTETTFQWVVFALHCSKAAGLHGSALRVRIPMEKSHGGKTGYDSPSLAWHVHGSIQIVLASFRTALFFRFLISQLEQILT
jgi:hypothetical protein